MTFGQKLKASREKAGLTMIATAKLIGIPGGTYEGWEYDRHAPSAILQAFILELISDATKK